MINKLARQRRSAAYRLVLFQLVVTLLVSLSGFALWDKDVALLIAKGGAISVIPGFMFATLAFSRFGAKASEEVLGAFYLGVTMKLMLTMVLFIYVFAATEITSPGALFTGYITAVLVHWAAPLFFQQKQLG